MGGSLSDYAASPAAECGSGNTSLQMNLSTSDCGKEFVEANYATAREGAPTKTGVNEIHFSMEGFSSASDAATTSEDGMSTRSSDASAPASKPAPAINHGRKHNFSAGPASIKASILEEVQAEILNYQETGAGFMELSHRDAGGPFQTSLQNCVWLMKELLEIPDTHDVLFFQGGAHAQFSAVPLNICDSKEDVIGCGMSGFWCQRARTEAERYVNAETVFDCAAEGIDYKYIPEVKEWKIPEGAKYVSICANETIHGLEFLSDPNLAECENGVDPETGKLVPLVMDATSTLLSRPVDVSKYGVIFASSGKNMGPAGICVVIVRKDLIQDNDKKEGKQFVVPSIMDWQKQAETVPVSNIYNTPPTFQVYMLEKILKDYKACGGPSFYEARAKKRADTLYNLIDESGKFYLNDVSPKYRSRMNIPFRIAHPSNPGVPCKELETLFTKNGEKYGLMQVFGHPLFGGQRITLYNSIEDDSFEAVLGYMREFMAAHGGALLD